MAVSLLVLSSIPAACSPPRSTCALSSSAGALASEHQTSLVLSTLLLPAFLLGQMDRPPVPGPEHQLDSHPSLLPLFPTISGLVSEFIMVSPSQVVVP